MGKYFILTLFFLAASNIYGQKQKCFTLDNIVKQTLKALETKDIKMYLEVWDKAVLQEAVAGTKDEKLMQKADKLTETHKENFNALLKQMKVQLHTEIYQINLIKYETMTPMNLGWMTAYGTDIYFMINGVKRKINAPISEYKGCYYLFSPIDDMLQSE